MEDSVALRLINIGLLKHVVGMKFGHFMARQKHEWLRKAPKQCRKCRRYLTYGERSIDHIVPKIVAEELQLYELIWDTRNFQVLCEDCNKAKGCQMPQVWELPDYTIELLQELGYPIK